MCFDTYNSVYRDSCLQKGSDDQILKHNYRSIDNVTFSKVSLFDMLSISSF